jgi:BASS family bile acid:Na+ symporter
MSVFFRRYFTSLVVVSSILLGFLFPQVGLIWKAYLSVFLMLLMFFVTLGIDPKEIVTSASNYPLVLTGLFTVFVLVPLLSLPAKFFFSSIVYAGIVLALCCPSAIVSAFWTKLFKGDIATALVMSITTNLLSIVTIPATMLLAAGAALNVDVVSMMLNLAEIILLPMAASYLVRRYIHVNWQGISAFGSRIELVLLVLVIWGSVAPGAAIVASDISGFFILNVFMFALLAIAFLLTHLLTERFGHKKAISIGIATTVKNAALSLVIGLAAFGASSPQILPPLIANLIAQNLLLIPAKELVKEIPHTA